MMTDSFASRDSTRQTLRDRAIADRQLPKTLLIGLCCSLVAHTAALAGIGHLAQIQSDDDLQITTIDRVNIDPEPKPTPTPVVKSTPVPIPKPVKPKIAAAPKPIPVKAPPPEVKITKSAVATKPQPSPLADFTPPIVKQTQPTTPVKTPPKVAIKPVTAPKFPPKLFTDPAPKQPSKKIEPEKTTARPTTKPATPTKPKVVNEPQDLPNLDPDNSQESNPIAPGNPEKIARSTPVREASLKENRTPSSTNQTNLTPSTKSTQNWRNNPSTPQPDPTANNDDFGSGTPGNNQKIASTPNIAPANSSNQTGLAGGTPKNRIGNFDGIGGNPNSSNDELNAGTPGNSKRIATGNSGGNRGGQNQTGLGGGGKKSTAPLGGDSNGNRDGIGGNNNESIGGVPGNIATGSKPQVSIQCLRNCEIKYPENLEASDTGKDKILVRVTIDPGGSVTDAQIARSSGNPNLDRVTLDGIKQMQLTAMGKTMTFRAKVSTLTN